MWSLCLSISNPSAATKKQQQQQQRREIVQLESTATLNELLQVIRETLQHDKGDTRTNNNNNNKTRLLLKAGFPPTPLWTDDADNGSKTLQQVGLTNQERILVTVLPEEQAAKKTATNSKQKQTKKKTKTKTRKKDSDSSEEEEEEEPTTTTTTAATIPPPRARRAAAQKATDSFAQVIQAPDNAMLEQQKSPKPKATIKPKPKTTTTRKRFAAAHTTGRRLQDGATVSPKRPRASSQRNNNSSSNNNGDDPSLALLNTLESSNSRGRLMRKGWRLAVQNSFEQNKAVARLAALEAGRVQFRLDDNDDDDMQQLEVTFSKGIQGRGDYQETVDALPWPVLQQVVADIYPANPQALRPSNLALLSPRVMWSLAYHSSLQQAQSQQAQQPTPQTSIDIQVALQSLQPDLDWSFLQRRKQELSAKARENLRQQQENDDDQQDENWEAAAAAIASVEQAMERAGNVAEKQRAGYHHQNEQPQQDDDDNSDEGSQWQLETPNELDRDELLACVEECVVSEVASSACVDWLQMECHIHNWRELANVESGEALIQQFPSLPLSATAVQAWIDRARLESVDEIMVQVCDDQVAAVQLLMNQAQTCTPRDLELWLPLCDELHTILVEQVDKNKNNNDMAAGNNATLVPSVALLQKWCRQAEKAREQYPWLRDATGGV